MSFEYYDECAAENGYEAGPQHRGYLFKVHVDETEELADEVGRKYLTGPGNIFLEGSRGDARGHLQNLPGLTDRRAPPPHRRRPAGGRSPRPGHPQRPRPPPHRPRLCRVLPKDVDDTYKGLIEAQSIITGTPKTVLPKIRNVLEYLRPGSIFLWDGDGSMSHEDAMRSLRLMGEEVLPAVREMGEELGLDSPFEVDPATNEAAPARRRRSGASLHEPAAPQPRIPACPAASPRGN